MDLYLFSHIALWILALILAPVTFVMLYQFSYIRGMHDLEQEFSEHEELSIGNRQPHFAGRELHSKVIRREQEWIGTRHIILALSPTCVSCSALVSELASMTRDDFAGMTIVALCVGSDQACRAKMSAIRAIPVLSVREGEAIEFITTGLPSAIAVDKDGVIEDVRIPNSVAAVLDMAAVKNRAADGIENRIVTQATIKSTAAQQRGSSPL